MREGEKVGRGSQRLAAHLLVSLWYGFCLNDRSSLLCRLFFAARSACNILQRALGAPPGFTYREGRGRRDDLGFQYQPLPGQGPPEAKYCGRVSSGQSHRSRRSLSVRFCLITLSQVTHELPARVKIASYPIICRATIPKVPSRVLSSLCCGCGCSLSTWLTCTRTGDMGV